MGYVALYRQWRPQDFDTLVGQNHISTTLKNALATGKIAHAYLFAGPRGTGKTSTAKILAKALNCVNGPTPTPCNVCDNCRRITDGTSMDVFEVDAASNRGIDEIRDLRETVKFAPVDGRYKVYIIDEVHMLTTEAFNALLKTLEEPPAHVVFVLATTESHKIPATIHSRCQRYDFRRISVDEICCRLEEVAAHNGLKVQSDALRLIAVHADGGLRDALSILDQCIAMGGEVVDAEQVRSLLGLIGQEWIWQLTAYLAECDVKAALLKLNDILSFGKDARQVLLETAQHFRSLMLYKAAPDIDNINMYSEDKTVLGKHSGWFSHEEIVDIISTLSEAANEAKWAPEPRISAEVAFLSICRRQQNKNLAQRVAELENAVKSLLQGESRPKRLPENPWTPEVKTPISLVNTVRQAAAKTVKPERNVQAADIPPSTRQPSEDLGLIWDKVLKELLSAGKRSVHACVSQGQLIDVSNSQALIQFAGSFPKERTEKEDYRTIVEGVFTQVCGFPVRVVCSLGAPVKKSPKAPNARAEDQGAPGRDVPDVKHPALEQAVKMFGGKVIIDENEN